MSEENENSFAEVLVSRWKLDVLDELSSRPKYEFTINELAESTSGSYGSVRAFVHSLRDWGVVEIVRKGGSLLVSIDRDSEYSDLIQELLKTESEYLRERARKYVEELVDEFPGVEKVLLYGSVARNEAGLSSDIDLLILGDASEKKVRDYAHSKSREATISPIVESTEEFEQNLEEEKEFEKQVKQDCITLYSED